MAAHIESEQRPPAWVDSATSRKQSYYVQTSVQGTEHPPGNPDRRGPKACHQMTQVTVIVLGHLPTLDSKASLLKTALTLDSRQQTHLTLDTPEALLLPSLTYSQIMLRRLLKGTGFEPHPALGPAHSVMTRRQDVPAGAAVARREWE